MKALFAVSALAAAISTQAIAADTETTTSFTGAMEMYTIYSFQNEYIDVDLSEDDDFLYGVSMAVDVVNGPFSASVGIESDEGRTDFDIGDIVITDGPLKFGQVGSLVATDAYIDATVSMTDDSDEEDAVVALGEDIGFNYMVMEGAYVQIGGTNYDSNLEEGDEGYGEYGYVGIFSGSYAGEMDALSFVVDGQVNDDSEMYLGAGVTYDAGVATVTAGLNYASESAMEYAVDVAATVAGATIGAGYYEPNSDVDDNESIVGEVSYAIDAVTVSGGYTFTTAESAGDELTAGVAWAEGMLSASVDVTIEEFDADESAEPEIDVALGYTSEAGVYYELEYIFQDGSQNHVALIGQYSF